MRALWKRDALFFSESGTVRWSFASYTPLLATEDMPEPDLGSGLDESLEIMVGIGLMRR